MSASLPEFVGPHFKAVEVPGGMTVLDKLFFKRNPDRDCLLRRPAVEENINTTEGSEVLMFVHKCREHGAHKTAIAFLGQCLKFSNDSDDVVDMSMDMILAEPDGKGN